MAPAVPVVTENKDKDKEGDTVMEDDLGIPLATPTQMMSSKRAIDQDENEEPEKQRARLAGLEVEGRGVEGTSAAGGKGKDVEGISARNLESELEFDVSEIFSRARVTKVAEKFNLRGGYALDILEKDIVTGKAWDLDKDKFQGQLWSLLAKVKSRLVVATPPCRTFSRLQNLRKTRMSHEEWDIWSSTSQGGS